MVPPVMKRACLVGVLGWWGMKEKLVGCRVFTYCCVRRGGEGETSDGCVVSGGTTGIIDIITNKIRMMKKNYNSLPRNGQEKS